MNKRLLFGIVSCGLLAGFAIYWVNKTVNKDSVNQLNEELLNGNDSLDLKTEHWIEDTVMDIDAIKMQSVNSMNDRHKVAALVVKESIEKINENVDLPSDHKEEFDSMFEELNMLSKEI